MEVSDTLYKKLQILLKEVEKAEENERKKTGWSTEKAKIGLLREKLEKARQEVKAAAWFREE